MYIKQNQQNKQNLREWTKQRIA